MTIRARRFIAYEGVSPGSKFPSRAAAPANAQYGMDKKQPAGTPELPRCDRPLGTAAVKEPDNQWWTPLGLSNPEALLKLFASRSNCLRPAVT